jgi:uncharacterized membrane protein SirB2
MEGPHSFIGDGRYRRHGQHGHAEQYSPTHEGPFCDEMSDHERIIAAIMLLPYGSLLITHVSCAAASPVLFSLRAWRSIRSRDPAQGWLRVTPHVVDSLLLLAGLSLALVTHQYPFVSGWLTAKLFALVAYIAVGHLAVRRAHTVRKKVSAWLVGLAIVAYIYAVAATKDPTVGLGPH